MINIFSFETFLISESSKNTPIPELLEKEKLGIILLGVPGSGKSTFSKNVINKYQRNIKLFSTDDVSLKFTKDPSKYHIGSAGLNIQYLLNYMNSGQNFIYDTTGANDKAVFDVFKSAKRMGYKVVFILMLIDLETAKNQNLSRFKEGGHKADQEYIEFVYSRQLRTTKDFLKYLNPDSFYIVNNKNGKYKYYKHTGDEILKRKVDKYVSFKKPMKVFESATIKNELVDKIKYLSHYLETYLNDVNKFTTSNLNLQFSYGTVLDITEILKLGGGLNYDSPDGLITAVAQQFIIWSEYFTKDRWFKEKLKSFNFEDGYLNFTDEYKQSNRQKLYQQGYNHLLYGYIGETIRHLITGTIWDIPESKEFTDEDKDFILDCLSSDYDDISSEYISKASDMIDTSKTLDNSKGYIIRIPLGVKIDYDDDFIHRLCSYFGGVLILKSDYRSFYKLCLPFYK